jgi:hypothetical protein
MFLNWIIRGDNWPSGNRQERRNRDRTGQKPRFFLSSETVDTEFILEGATVKEHRYKERLRRKRPELIQEELAKQRVTCIFT